MDFKSKTLFVVFILIILAAIGLSYYRYMVLRDYYVTVEEECDPQIEKCFVYECDPADDSECPTNPEERVSYYKIIQKKAYNIPLCDPQKDDCPPLTCADDPSCLETLCDESGLAEGEVCSTATEDEAEVTPDVADVSTTVVTTADDITAEAATGTSATD